MSPFRVSVVIPTRDRVNKLRRALGSVEGQIYRDFDVWVVDDGSKDGTSHYLRQEGLEEDYPGIPALHVIVNNRPAGAAAARNQAVKRSEGEFIAFLDDDDAWAPEFLQQQVANLDRHPRALVSYAGYLEVNREGGRRRPDMRPLFQYETPLVQLLTESYIHTLSIITCRRRAFTQAGYLDPGLRIVHDLDWYARLLLSGGEIIPLGSSPLVMREMPGGLVKGHRLWFDEERGVIGRACRLDQLCARNEKSIRAHRALLFSRIGISRGDYSFAAARLLEALGRAPFRSMRIVFERLRRNLSAGDEGGLGKR